LQTGQPGALSRQIKKEVNKMTKEKLLERGLVRYNDLSEGAKKEAYNRFAWDFINEKPNGKSHEEIMAELNKHWFDKNGATFLGTY